MKEMIDREVKVKGQCFTQDCENKCPTGTYCGSCRSRKSRLADPIRYSYMNKKHRADEREIFFDLTLEEFREFCHETSYMNKKGKVSGSYDVDRIIEGKTPGYTRSNIQVLEKVNNIKKYKKYDAESKKAVEVVEIIFPKEDLPF